MYRKLYMKYYGDILRLPPAGSCGKYYLFSYIFTCSLGKSENSWLWPSLPCILLLLGYMELKWNIILLLLDRSGQGSY